MTHAYGAGYDDAGHMTSRTETDRTNGANVYSTTFGYDSRGNLVWQVNAEGTGVTRNHHSEYSGGREYHVWEEQWRLRVIRMTMVTVRTDVSFDGDSAGYRGRQDWVYDEFVRGSRATTHAKEVVMTFCNRTGGPD